MEHVKSLFLSFVLLCGSLPAAAAESYRPVDTQTSGQPQPPREAQARLRLPEGFKLTLAAAEPDVRQPIAIAYDERGRLWVAESYSYDGSHFTTEKHDRILIFDDEDGDGVFEKRTVFHDKLNRLTGLVVGFGGVWVATAPTLSFIPDRDGDDVPDGPPVAHLDGWTLKAEHNSVNGLTWGPDGWLYGRHGIKEPSRPGRPGTPQAQRPLVSCSIWRYHPTRQIFEVVAEGTVNPWGLDFDEHGQMFISTSVVDHLWHVVPGARFKRVLGREAPIYPHVYELMEQANDHSHRTLAKIATVAGASNADDDAAGGHSHSDAMIYLGDHWPAEYRGTVLMSNIHGRRINRDRFVRVPDGSYRAAHAPDFLRADDPWFRSISLEYGPDGDVVMTDWSDNGECHDRDGVHRNSGRIYKISWGAPRRVAVDLRRASLDELVQLQAHRNEWYVRQARRVLQERATAGVAMGPVHTGLRELFAQAETTSAFRLRALWALYVTEGLEPSWLLEQLSHRDEHVRHWAVRLLADRGAVGADVASRLVARAKTENSWLMRMALASALPSVDDAQRWQLGAALAQGVKAKDDPNLLRLLWLGWHATLTRNAAQSLALVDSLSAPTLQEWIVRRLAEQVKQEPAMLGRLLDALRGEGTVARLATLRGMAAGLEQQASAPSETAIKTLGEYFSHQDASVQRVALLLGARLRSEAAIERLRTMLKDDALGTSVQTEVLQALAAVQPAWLAEELLALVRRGQVVEPALRALVGSSDAMVAPALLELYPKLSRSERIAAMDTMLARESSLAAVLDALAAGRLEKREISQQQARQVIRTAPPALRTRFDALWGRVNTASSVVAAQMRKLRATMKPDFIALGSTASGRMLFEQRCASCHTLFGKGGNLGPDLTGSGRKDLDYLIGNIVDPNAAIPADWRLTIVTLTDGRVLSGSLTLETDSAVSLKSAEGIVTIERNSIRALERAETSLMPMGLLDDLSPESIRDLFAFLMSDGR